MDVSGRILRTWMPAIHAGMSAPVMALYQHGESPCRSMPQTPQPKVTALARSNVGSNRKRIVGP